MWLATAIATALAFAPSQTPTPTPPAEFDVSDLEIEIGADTMHVVTFDAGGDQSGEVTITSDGRRLDANFADGLHVTARVNERGEIVEFESSDRAEATRRMEAIRDFDLAAVVDPDATKGEVMCYAGLVGAASCVTGNVIGCMVAGFIISCNCLPLVNGTPTPGCD